MFRTPDPKDRAWRKSSRSGSNGCVEVRLGPSVVGVRDSKVPNGPEFRVDAVAWRDFVGGVAAGEFDLPRDSGSGA